MKKILCLLLFCVIVLTGLSVAQAGETALPTGGQSGAATDSTVARTAYLQDKEAGKPGSTVPNGQNDCNFCCDSCSEKTCECCCTQCLCGDPGFIGGYDFLFLRPHFSNATSYASYYDDGTDVVETLYGYPTDYAFTPRFWLGYQGYEGLGARVRYMQYDQQLMAVDATAPADTYLYHLGMEADPGEELHFRNYLEMHVLDVEFTQDFEWRYAKLTAGAGLRYAKIEFTNYGYVSDTVVLEATVSEHSFEGTGPTMFVDVKAPIRGSALSLVGGLRGSVLFGRSHGALAWINPIAEESYVELGSGDRTMGVLEANVGLQYDYALSDQVDSFIRLTWEGQLWFDAGSPTTDDSDLGMEGLCVAVGITR